MKIAELFAEIGFDINDGPLSGFVSLMQGAAGQILKFTAYIGGAAFAINKFTDRSIQAAAALRSFRVETGLSAVELQRWQRATQLTDISASAEDVTASIQALQSNLAQIRLGQGNIRPFQLLGVSAQGDAFDVLRRLRVALKGVDEATQVNLLQEMGLGPEFVHTLRLTGDEFDKLANKYLLSDRQIDDLTRVGTAFQDLGNFISHTVDEFNAFMSPVYIGLAKGLEYAIRLIVNPVKLLWMGLKELDGLLGGSLVDHLKAFAVIFAGLAIIFNPVLLAISAVTAALLALEDIFIGLSGGDSVIFGWFKDLAEWVSKAVDPINEMINGLSSLNPFDSEGFTFSGVAESVGNSASNMFNNVFNITSDNPQAVAAAVSSGLQDQLDYGLANFNNSGR